MSHLRQQNFRINTSLSQQVSDEIKDLQFLAGTDPETSLAIQRLKVFGRHGLINLDSPIMKLALDLLDGERLARFATSDKTNEVTKLGLMLPKSRSVVSDFNED